MEPRTTSVPRVNPPRPLGGYRKPQPAFVALLAPAFMRSKFNPPPDSAQFHGLAGGGGFVGGIDQPVRPLGILE
jgi:hypothetical protein